MNKIKSVFFLVILLIFTSLSFSDGVIIPVEWGETKNPFVLLEHDVNIIIDELIATVKIEETFWNNSDVLQKVVYFFPIPDKAVISDFKMKIGEEFYTGEIMDSEAARQEFTELVKKNKNPSLLEFMDDNYYRIEIPSFNPHEERAISLTYTQELSQENGLVQLKYPLEIESLLDSEIKNISIKGIILSKHSDIYFVESSSNEINSTISSDKHTAEFNFSREAFTPKNDFVLKYGLGKNEVEAYMTTDTPDMGYNTFLLEIHPDIEYDYYQPKDVVFVLDKSGSMSGIKFVQAQEAAKFIISRLYEDDRFNLILFNHDINAYKHLYTLFDDSEKQDAIDWIYSSYAEGNTNIYGSLDMALRVFQNANNIRNPILVFLTDGIPTEGIEDPELIVNHVNDMGRTIQGLRIFTFGVGYDVNTYILDLLTVNNNGQTFYVTEDESIETEIARMFSNISKPVLSNIKLEFISDTVEILDYLPNKGLTVYKDEPLKIFGRYRGSGEVTLKISGKLGESDYQNTFTFNVQNDTNKSISLLWASRQISNLINQIRLTGETQELKSEVVQLSKTFSIPTQYTSYLVSDDTTDLDFADRDLKVQPQTQGSAVPPFASNVNSPTASPKNQTGKVNVLQSKNMNQMSMAKQAEEAEDLMQEAMNQADYRLLQGKRFIWHTDLDAWVDDEFIEENVITIKKYSKEYFELIEVNKTIVEYLQFEAKIYLRIDDKNYIIEE